MNVLPSIQVIDALIQKILYLKWRAIDCFFRHKFKVHLLVSLWDYVLRIANTTRITDKEKHNIFVGVVCIEIVDGS